MGAGTGRDTGRLFAVHASITLVPVLVLGFVLGTNYRHDVDRRGIEEGKREAALVAETAIEPLLTGHPLEQGLRAPERAALVRLVRSVDSASVLRLRIRGRDGRVVF